MFGRAPEPESAFKWGNGVLEVKGTNAGYQLNFQSAVRSKKSGDVVGFYIDRETAGYDGASGTPAGLYQASGVFPSAGSDLSGTTMSLLRAQSNQISGRSLFMHRCRKLPVAMPNTWTLCVPVNRAEEPAAR